jgi:hypothetical protein
MRAKSRTIRVAYLVDDRNVGTISASRACTLGSNPPTANTELRSLAERRISGALYSNWLRSTLRAARLVFGSLRIARLLALCAVSSILLLVACKSEDQTITRGLESAEQLRSALLGKLVPGSDSSGATEFMRKNEFKCQMRTNASWVDLDNIDYLHCDKHVTARFPVSRRWQVAIVVEKNKIRDILVTTGLVGP